MNYFLPTIAAGLALLGSAIYPLATSAQGISLNLMSSNNPEDIVDINWEPIKTPNPFSVDTTVYEIWHNHSLLDTVDKPQYRIKLSELDEHHGCISIRAVRGSIKSGYSVPACFLVKSY